MGDMAERIRRKLEAEFAPASLEVKDDSALHAGHTGAREGGESHFTVVIVAEAFAGLSRVERQRRVNGALREELAGPVHALSIRASAPAETTGR